VLKVVNNFQLDTVQITLSIETPLLHIETPHFDVEVSLFDVEK